MDLWDFSLSVYDDAGVQSACLDLQDEFGADVNVLLCVLLHGYRGQVLSVEAIRAMDHAVSPWRDTVVRPLRRVRRELKAGAFGLVAGAQEGFRTQIKKVELQSEKLQQEILGALSPDIAEEADREAAARLNVARYAGLIGAPEDDASFAVLLRRLEQI